MANSVNLKEFIEKISYNKSQTYTKEEVLSEIEKFQILTIVERLPTENILTNKIYLVLNNEDITGNKYDLYVYADNKWEQIDSLEFNIEDYPTKTELQYSLSLKSDKGHGHGNVTASIDGFMSKEDKAKLDTINPSDSNPLMDGTASQGTSTKYSRQDHSHPSDTSKVNVTQATANMNLVTGSDKKVTLEAKNNHSHGNVNSDGSISNANGKNVVTDSNGKITTEDKYTHPSYTVRTGKPTTNQTPSFGESVTVSQITSDNQGHITNATDRTIKIPDNLGDGTNKGLSTNDYTNLEKDKLEDIEDGANNYTHPTYTAKSNGLYKVTVDNTGHISGTASVSASDLPSHEHDTGNVKDTSAYSNIGSSANSTQKTINNNINTKLGTKANSSDVYTKSQTLTASEITQAIADGVSNVSLFEVVTALPTTNIKGNKFYLINNGETVNQNVYDIYIYVNNKWEQIDSLEFDIDNYYTISQVDNLLNGKVNTTDSRLTDTRTPKSHSHGNITNTGAIGNASGKIVTTGTNGVLTTSDTITKDKISDFPTSMTPTSHTHGSIQNNGTLNSDITSVNKVVVTDSSNNVKTISKLPLANVTHQDISGKINTSAIKNDLTTGGATNVLSAEQGKQLKAQIDSIVSGETATDHNHDGQYLKTGTGTVTSTNIANGTIVNDDIANTTITGGKLANGTVTATQLASNSVETVKIKDANVTNAKLSDLPNLVTEYIVGTQTASTSAWTGKATKITSLQTGQVIYYKLPYASTSTAVTLNLTLADGSTTGAKEVWFWNGARMNTNYGVNSVIGLVYNGSQWWTINPSNNNSNTYLTTADHFISGEALTSNNLIACKKADNKYYKINTLKNTVINLSRPLLLSNGNVNANTNSSTSIIFHPWISPTNLNGGTSLTLSSTVYQPVYLEGTAYSNGEFTVSSTPITQTLTSGRFYIMIGVAYATNGLGVDLTRQTVYYYNGTNLIESVSWNGVVNKPTTFTPSSHTHSDTQINWNGSALAGQVSPIDMAMYEEFSANRLAYLPSKDVTVEYSTNGGSTWTDYGATDAQKMGLVTTSASFVAGKGATASANNQLRITINAGGGNNVQSDVYVSTRKLMIYYSTSGGSNTKVKIETSNYGTPTTWNSIGEYNISGYSGWNSYPLSITYGGMASQTTGTRIQNIRLTFTTGTAHNFSVQKIRLFGENCWIKPSTFAETGHLYTYDVDKNVTFPAKIIKSGGTSSQFLKADGSVDSNSYLTTSSASSTYLSKTDASNTYQAKGNYLTSHNPVDSALSSTSTNAVQNKVINTALDNKVDKVSGKGLSTNDFTATYKTALDNLNTTIANAVSNLEMIEVVTSLPTSNIKTNKLYLKANSVNGSENKYDFYVRVNNAWEKVDSLDFSISDYIKKDSNTNLLLSNGTTKAQSSFIANSTGSVTSTHIADKTIVNGDIADGTIESGKIKDGTIVNDDIANTTITGGKLVNGTITGTQLADNSVTSAKIVNGTITNDDIANQTIGMEKLAVHVDGGTSGTAGYVKLLRFTITGTYQDRPITFKVERRHATELVDCSLTFKGANNNDPGLSSFVCNNEMGFTGNNLLKEMYLYKEDTSTWSLIIRKSENYDAPKITMLYNPQNGITISKIKEFITTLPTASTTNPLQEIVGLNNISEYIEGTHGTTATGTWTGVSKKIMSLTKGTVIFFKMTSAGTSTGATLNLTLADGTSTGAKSVYYNATTAFTTHLPQNTVLHLVYDGSKWINTAIQNTNTDTHNALEQGTRINIGATVTANQLVGRKYTDGKYYPLGTSNLIIDASYPIFYMPSASNAVNGYNYPYHLKIGVNLQTTKSGVTITANEQVFVEGTQLNSNQFAVSSAVFKSETGLVNGYYYIPIGGSAGSTTNINFNSIDQTVYKKTSNGLIPISDWETIEGKPSTFTPSTHTHSYLPLSGGTLTGAVSSNSNITTSGTVQGATIKKTNGTSSQFLKADGSVDSNVYIHTAGTNLSKSGNTLNHATSGVTAGTNYNGNQTPAFGGTFNIPKLSFDAQGHITASGTSTVKIPAHSHTFTYSNGTLTIS